MTEQTRQVRRQTGRRSVTHAELQALVAHISTLYASLDVRIGECERVLAVDPQVGESARAFLERARKAVPAPLALVKANDPVEQAVEDLVNGHPLSE